ncbi:transposase, partial [Neisseria meningitidis]|uniref:transposase n=2 Tax=Neisseria meningitidis TaxID=487 RepID=UPI000FF32542
FDGKAQVAEQIKGIGSITTATLMAMLPELGRLSHKRIASLAGIAPHPRESGETKAATRFEPLIRDFYQRLLSEGKPYKVAVAACMRKLLETFAKFLSLPTAETQTQVFVYFRS